MPPKQTRKKPDNGAPIRVKLIEAISTPLGFFVLALLIVEAFLTAVLLGADLDSAQKVNCITLGVTMFLVVVVVVSALVWFKPFHLTFDKDAHLLDRGKVPFGTNQEKVSAEAALSGQKLEEVGP